MDLSRRHILKSRRTVLAGAALMVALVFASIGPASAALSTPTAIGPSNGAAVTAPPIFAWQPVAGADKYEFELSANPGFDSSVAAVTTRNTRATLKEVIANGSYYWRVRAITAAGATGPWTSTRSLEMAWTAKPSLLAPANGSTLVYPSDAFRLEWTPVDGASEYFVSVATDPALGSLIWTSPVRTSATSFTLSAPLAPGTYYWAVTPLDAEGHAGTPASTASFQWSWPSTTTTTFTDLAPAAEIVDPSFSWTAVPGAAGYEVEVELLLRLGARLARSAARRCTLGSQCGDPRPLALPDRAARQQHLLLARAGHRLERQRRRVERRRSVYQDVRERSAVTTAPSVKNLRLRDNLGDPNDGVDPSTVRLPARRPEPRCSRGTPSPARPRYQVDVTPVRGRRLQLDAFAGRALGRDHVLHLVDAARLGLEQREAVPEPGLRLGRLADDGRRAHLLRPRAAVRPRLEHLRPDGVRRLDVPSGEQHACLHLGRSGGRGPARRARSPRPTTSSRRPA